MPMGETDQVHNIIEGAQMEDRGGHLKIACFYSIISAAGGLLHAKT